MNDIIMKIIKNKVIVDEDLEKALYGICNREHAYCNENCPIYALGLMDKANGGFCAYFKKGAVMLKALKKSYLG